MDKKLNWINEAFSRTLVIQEDGQPVGGMHRNAFGQDVDAHLHDLRIRFDVLGFLIQTVNIHDVANGNQIIGQIRFHFGKRAELTLKNGERYEWKRHNILMRDWDMIREGPDDGEHEVVSYSLTRRFFGDHGDIALEDNRPTAPLVLLTGLFIRNYFQRRRRFVAVGAIAAAGA